MAKSKLVSANRKIENAVVGGYRKIEKGVTGGFKKMSDGVVKGYTKIEDKFVANKEAKELFENKLKFKWFCVVRDEKMNQRYIKYYYSKKEENYDINDNHELTKAENAVMHNKNNFMIDNLMITSINQENNNNLLKQNLSKKMNHGVRPGDVQLPGRAVPHRPGPGGVLAQGAELFGHGRGVFLDEIPVLPVGDALGGAAACHEDRRNGAGSGLPDNEAVGIVGRWEDKKIRPAVPGLQHLPVIAVGAALERCPRCPLPVRRNEHEIVLRIAEIKHAAFRLHKFHTRALDCGRIERLGGAGRHINAEHDIITQNVRIPAFRILKPCMTYI